MNQTYEGDRIAAARADSRNGQGQQCTGDGCVVQWKPKRRSDKVYEALFGTVRRSGTETAFKHPLSTQHLP